MGVSALDKEGGPWGERNTENISVLLESIFLNIVLRKLLK
jgi:hypothetical protein